MKTANSMTTPVRNSAVGEKSSFIAQSKQAIAGAGMRWKKLANDTSRRELFGTYARACAPQFARNIENYVGTINIPVGIAGPLHVLGEKGNRTYQVPLATTEAALVASYNRGARLLTAAGGCAASVVSQRLSRTPLFAFRRAREALEFASWSGNQQERFRLITRDLTRHGNFLASNTVIEGNHVYLELVFSTGDAAGQNMVTFASDAICRWLLGRSPVAVQYWFLEANLSGDKKATAQALRGVRGRRVIAEAEISRQLLETYLHTTPERMVEYWSAGAIGGVLSGAIGMQGHYANGLAALYLACGQDIACVAESAVGVTRFSVTETGGLYASVTLPNILVGTVGGGTGLPFARACLEILGLAGEGHSDALAEVCAATVLAGELSIVAAFCSDDFAKAHHSLSRGVVSAEVHSHE